MIPYIEIRDRYTRNTLAIVEPQECWFELSYYDIGQFEIYCVASKETIDSLKKGRFVTIPNKPYIWIITSVQYDFKADGTRMISAKGYEAKWLLTSRIIMSNVELYGDIGQTVKWLVDKSMGETANSQRKIENFVVKDVEIEILTELQATRENIWDFVSSFLKSNGVGSLVYLRDGGVLSYELFMGWNKTSDVIFSQSMDNLISSTYQTTNENKKTYCLVVNTFTEQNAKGENVENEYTKEVNIDESANPIDRAEMTTSPNLSLKYTDESGVEKETTPTTSLFQSWQEQAGISTLADHRETEEINGEIDMNNSNYEFETDYFIGDRVKVIDEDIDVPFYPIITKVTMKQDSSGYGLEVSYETSN